jgi:hypothetical protein
VHGVHGWSRARCGNQIMNSAKKVFLLPCAGCACEIDVVSGQAGGLVECPSCGRHNEVPKFRDLNELQLKSQPAGGRSTRWGLPHAVALTGLVCAALAWGTAALVGSTPKAAFDVSLIRASVEAGDDAVLYRSLNAYAQSTVDRPPMRGEVDVQRRALFAQGMSRALYAIGGLGALAAAVAGVLVLASGKRS